MCIQSVAVCLLFLSVGELNHAQSAHSSFVTLNGSHRLDQMVFERGEYPGKGQNRATLLLSRMSGETFDKKASSPAPPHLEGRTAQHCKLVCFRTMSIGGVTVPLEETSREPHSVVYTGIYDTEGVTHTKSGERQPIQVNMQVLCTSGWGGGEEGPPTWAGEIRILWCELNSVAAGGTDSETLWFVFRANDMLCN